MVSCPKDKEEMQKKKMAAMFKKIGGNQDGGKPIDGEERLE
jgi:hypothetical protein